MIAIILAMLLVVPVMESAPVVTSVNMINTTNTTTTTTTTTNTTTTHVAPRPTPNHRNHHDRSNGQRFTMLTVCSVLAAVCIMFAVLIWIINKRYTARSAYIAIN